MRVMYVGRDQPERGLEHGKHYHVKKERLRNGKLRVTVEETREKMTMKDEFEFVRYFMPKDSIKPKRRKAEK